MIQSEMITKLSWCTSTT